MANNMMMHGNLMIAIGLLLVLDAFIGIQGMIGFVQINVFNGFEFILGLAVVFLGFKAREHKMR